MLEFQMKLVHVYVPYVIEQHFIIVDQLSHSGSNPIAIGTQLSAVH